MAMLQNRAGEDSVDELSEINVTPFIDVMLVLLIVFMVAAPLSTVDIAVDLPTSNAEQQMRPDKLIFLTVKSDLSLSIENDSVVRSALRSELDKRSNSDREQRVFLRADQAVPYGEIMKVMNLLREAGYLKAALVGLEEAK